MIKSQACVFVVLLLAAAGCAWVPVNAMATLKPQAQLSMERGGWVSIRVGATNIGARAYPANDNFQGVMELRDTAGELLSKIEIHMFPALEPQQTDLPSELRTQLFPGTYRLTWGAPALETLTVEFDILEREGKPLLRADPRYLDPMTDYTIAQPTR
jgi:hypothetical protein